MACLSQQPCGAGLLRPGLGEPGSQLQGMWSPGLGGREPKTLVREAFQEDAGQSRDGKGGR